MCDSTIKKLKVVCRPGFHAQRRQCVSKQVFFQRQNIYLKRNKSRIQHH